MRCKRLLACMLLALVTAFAGVTSVYAAATTVTLKNGNLESYGTYSTRIRWVTHVNGTAVDLADEPGVTRSYAYCVQPAMSTPDPGTYNVTVVDDDDTGRLSRMRKMIYYLPGAYGYKDITQSRWFSSLPSGTSAYTLGHVTLSYLYDNCSSDSDAWKGTNTAIKNKVLSMIDDLANLPDPPEEFEVFWIMTSGKQDTFGAFYATEYGKADVRKSSANTLITSNNSCYTLEGAEYTLYLDSSCTRVAKTKSGSSAVISVHADGSSDPVEVETGTYYVKETLAPRGFALDTEVYTIKVVRNKTTTLETSDVPKSNPVGLLLEKVDKETGLPVPQGAASLAGAEFTVKYYDVYADSEASEEDLLKLIADRKPADINGKEAKWEFRINKDCKIDISNPESTLISDRSADFYKNSEGENVFPIGIITVQETVAPRGYLRNTKVYARAITEEGKVETIRTLKTLTDDSAVDNQVYRADVEFSKSSEGLDRMQYVPFRITSLTTGESHIVVTDENGYANTSDIWNKHDHNTNAGKTDEDGVWFNGINDAAYGAKPSNTLAALPYDTYKLEELPCESNKGHKLFSDTITVKRNGVIIDLGTFDDELIPEQIEYKSPKTGDSSMLWLYGTAAVMALLEAALLTRLKKGDRLLNR